MKLKRTAKKLSEGRKGGGITSFMMFVKMRRLELIVDRPKIKQEEITTLCGTQWR